MHDINQNSHNDPLRPTQSIHDAHRTRKGVQTMVRPKAGRGTHIGKDGEQAQKPKLRIEIHGPHNTTKGEGHNLGRTHETCPTVTLPPTEHRRCRMKGNTRRNDSRRLTNVTQPLISYSLDPHQPNPNGTIRGGYNNISLHFLEINEIQQKETHGYEVRNKKTSQLHKYIGL